MTTFPITCVLALGCGGGDKGGDTTPAMTEEPAADGDMAADPAADDYSEVDDSEVDNAGGDATAVGPSAADQVAQGQTVWGDSCAFCHGDQGEGKGKKKPAVVGADALGEFATAADLYAFIKEKMPKDDPGTLSEADAWAVTAWVVQANGKLGDSALAADSAGAIQLK